MKQIAIVTGGSRGIGREVSRLLARKGYDLCINFRSNASAAEALRDELATYGSRIIAVQADVSTEQGVETLFSRVDKELGKVTAQVNNAAQLLPQSRVEAMTADRLNSMFQANITSGFLCCREAVKRMSTRRGGTGGSIVNVSSGAARLGSPNEYVDYAASKAALDILTKGLSLEVAEEGIRVNTVRPGSTYTDMHTDGGEPGRVDRVAPKIPMKRGAQPLEIAQAIVWLLSDDASYCTGSFLDVTGGL